MVNYKTTIIGLLAIITILTSGTSLYLSDFQRMINENPNATYIIVDNLIYSKSGGNVNILTPFNNTFSRWRIDTTVWNKIYWGNKEVAEETVDVYYYKTYGTDQWVQLNRKASSVNISIVETNETVSVIKRTQYYATGSSGTVGGTLYEEFKIPYTAQADAKVTIRFEPSMARNNTQHKLIWRFKDLNRVDVTTLEHSINFGEVGISWNDAKDMFASLNDSDPYYSVEFKNKTGIYSIDPTIVIGTYILEYNKRFVTEHCFQNCYIDWNLTVNKNFTINNLDKFKQWFNKGAGALDLLDNGVQLVEEITTEKTVPNIITNCFPYNKTEINGSMVRYENCTNIDKSYKVNATNSVYSDFNPLGKTLQAGKTYNLRTWGKKQIKLGENNIEVKISAAGFTLPFTWWNTSFAYRRNITLTENAGVTVTDNPIDMRVDSSAWGNKPYNDTIRTTMGACSSAGESEISSQVYNITQTSGVMDGFNVVFLANVTGNNTAPNFCMYYDIVTKGTVNYSSQTGLSFGLSTNVTQSNNLYAGFDTTGEGIIVDLRNKLGTNSNWYIGAWGIDGIESTQDSTVFWETVTDSSLKVIEKGDVMIKLEFKNPGAGNNWHKNYTFYYGIGWWDVRIIPDGNAADVYKLADGYLNMPSSANALERYSYPNSANVTTTLSWSSSSDTPYISGRGWLAIYNTTYQEQFFRLWKPIIPVTEDMYASTRANGWMESDITAAEAKQVPSNQPIESRAGFYFSNNPIDTYTQYRIFMTPPTITLGDEESQPAPPVPPVWRNQGQNATQGTTFNLYSEGFAASGMDWVWLETNESGYWENKTGWKVNNYTYNFNNSISYSGGANSPYYDVFNYLGGGVFSTLIWFNGLQYGGNITKIYLRSDLGGVYSTSTNGTVWICETNNYNDFTCVNDDTFLTNTDMNYGNFTHNNEQIAGYNFTTFNATYRLNSSKIYRLKTCAPVESVGPYNTIFAENDTAMDDPPDINTRNCNCGADCSGAGTGCGGGTKRFLSWALELKVDNRDWVNVSFSWQNSSVAIGTSVGWKIWFNDTLGNINSTNVMNFTLSNITDTCAYSGSGAWAVTCSDNCVIATSYDLAGNNLTLTGTGVFTVNANISSIDIVAKDNNCEVRKSNDYFMG
jgi:hypothetical protein